MELKNIKAQDLRVDDEGELMFLNGDFDVVVANDEHAKSIIYSYTGDWVQYPSVGCNIQDYLNGDIDPVSIQGLIETQLKIDGFVIDNFQIIKGPKNAEIAIKSRRLL